MFNAHSFITIFLNALGIGVCGVVSRQNRPSSLRIEDTSSNPTVFEQMVNVLKLKSAGFREETVYKRNPQSAKAREYDECAPLDILDRNRRDLNDAEDTHPCACQPMNLRSGVLIAHN